MLNPEVIAQVAHETNRAFCQSIGDNSQPSWEDAPDWQKTSAIDGATFHVDALRSGREPEPSASHENWLKQKEADGWKYGSVKDPEKKEHPCFVAYSELPIEQRQKDYLFAAVVKAFFECHAIEAAATAPLPAPEGSTHGAHNSRKKRPAGMEEK